MATNEKILVNYLHQTTYTNTINNQVGTDSDQDSIFGTGNLQRTVPTPAGDIAYVRKFGTAHTITDLTNLSDPGVANLTWTVKTADGVTTYGSRANGGAYTDGSTTASATAIRLEAAASGGNVTLPANMTITDATFGALTVILPAETIYDGDTRIFYISAGGSSYYDTGYIYGGGRHTPVLNSSRYSYFDLNAALSALASANEDGIEILDSATYDEKLDIALANFFVYATSGQNPIITYGIGQRTTRDVSGLFNNANSIFFNENGTNVDTAATGYEDTWHDPYATFMAVQVQQYQVVVLMKHLL
jgi:hypothetical protein